ncbi:hypothetical protein [Salinibacterium sp.]|uniref:hypothetical protein n=1 Tax=Salinibacterium sp. TaxID=1915057 RepID=UPI00286CE7BB|nr:hypothetical protein [Salinibacterium sp.]
MAACVSCSTALDPRWKYCVDCGTPVAAVGPVTIPGAIRPEGERRPPVTRVITTPVLIVIVLAITGSIAAFAVAAQWLG